MVEEGAIYAGRADHDSVGSVSSRIHHRCVGQACVVNPDKVLDNAPNGVTKQVITNLAHEPGADSQFG